MIQIQKITIVLILCASAALTATAQERDDITLAGVRTSDVSVNKNDGTLGVGMTLDISDLTVRSRKAVLLTPYLINGSDSLAFSAIGLYGHTRYIQDRRAGNMLTGEGDTTYRKSKAPNPIHYSATTGYQPWMDGATLGLCYQLYGCCGNQLDDQDAALALWRMPFLSPRYLYVMPPSDYPDEITEKYVEGSAFVDFPVNKTVIYPTYRNNTVELAKITASINQARGGDCTVKSVSLKGYASPESSWANNTRLAKGRTEAVREYIQQIYQFEPGIISTSFEPEDWEGLRRYVDASALEHRTEILALIDGNLKPDTKEAKIKALYPKEYRFLLDNCYPALRHTDYKIHYLQSVVSKKNDEARVVSGLHMLAQTYDKNSKEYEDAYETAVRMYPDDPAANLNAANAAMERGDMERARQLLAKAGDSPEASYACGVYAYLEKDYDTAETLLRQAADGGIAEAQELLGHIMERQQ